MSNFFDRMNRIDRIFLVAGGLSRRSCYEGGSHAENHKSKISEVIGKIGQKHWSVIFTYRGETIRIISARRAREEEVNAYEN